MVQAWLRRSNFSVLSFILIQAVFGRALIAEDLSESWSKIGLKGEMIQAFLSDELCLQNRQSFLGCVYSVNHILSGAKLPLFAAPTEFIAQMNAAMPNGKKHAIVHSFPAFQIILSPRLPDKIPRRSEFEAAVARTYEKINTDHSWDLFGLVSETIPPMIEYARSRLADPASESELVGTAFNRFFEFAADAHAGLIPKSVMDKMMKVPPPRYFADIGVTVGANAKRGIHIADFVARNASAIAAGLRIDDQLLSIAEDGKNFTELKGKSIDEVESMLGGAVDSTLHLRVARGSETITIEATRKPLLKGLIQANLTNDLGIPVGWIKIREFMHDSFCEDFRFAITELLKMGVQAWVLDVRGNGGGRPEYAVCAASAFLGDQKIVYEMRYFDPSMSPAQGKVDSKALTNLPLTVLIDASSASASEILAGALQDHGRATIVGVRSFGKGTMQGVGGARELLYNRGQLPMNMSSVVDQLYFKSTLARFYLPSGRTNQIEGILPNFEAYSKPEPTDAEKKFKREEDLFSNAYSSIGTPWREPNPGRIAAIKNCIEKSGRARSLYEARKDDAFPADYPLFYAQEVLLCSK